MPLGRRVKGASTRNVRPRCSAGVIPGGSSGGSSRGELPERSREEARTGSLEFCDGVELRGRRFDGVLVMVVNRSTCLLLQRGRASVVEQNGSSAGVFRVDGIPRKTVTCVAPGSSASESHGGNGMVMRMVACSWTRVVPTPSSSSASWIRICRQVRLIDDPLHVGQGDGARVLAVACQACARCRRMSLSKSFFPSSSSQARPGPSPFERDRCHC